jgi:hypothetical protein
MFRAMIPPIFRSTRPCVTACGIMHPRCCRPVAWKLPLPGYRPATPWIHYTTSCNIRSSAPEDGWDQRPKQVELIGIINKPLLLHLVGVDIIYINDARSNKYQIPLFVWQKSQKSQKHVRKVTSETQNTDTTEDVSF